MTAIVEQLPARRHERSWLTWGAAVFLGIETVHFVGGVLGNDWEGWGTFFANFAFVLVTGLVIVGLTFGLVVRWGLKPSPHGRNRAALTGLAAGLLTVASWPLFFTWAPVLLAPAAVLLNRVGLKEAQAGRGGRRAATVGLSLAVASIAFTAFMLGYAALHDGTYPIMGD